MNQWKREISSTLARTTGLPVNQFATIEYGQQKNQDAISAVITTGSPLYYLTKVRKVLPDGFVSYIGTTINHPIISTELVVGPGTEQNDILRLAQTRADNYDQDTESIISAVEKIRSSADIDIVHADTDSIGFILLNQPTNYPSFAELLLEICPDLSQSDNCQNIDSIIKTTQEEKFITLWWD